MSESAGTLSGTVLCNGGESGNRTVVVAELPLVPLGYIRDVLGPMTIYPSPFAGSVPTHIVRREIFNGQKWVDFDSAEATELLNKIVQRVLAK